MRIGVTGEQSGLEEDQAGQPDGSGATECGQQLFGCHRFDKEEKKRGEKDGTTV
jgi:hypothetical protein